MTELEDLIRDALRSREGLAPQGGALVAGVNERERVRRRRVRSLAVGGSTVAVVGVLLLAGLVNRGGSASPQGLGGSVRSGSPTTPTVTQTKGSSTFVRSLTSKTWRLTASTTKNGVWHPDGSTHPTLTMARTSFTAIDGCDSVGGPLSYDDAGSRVTFNPDHGSACPMSVASGQAPPSTPPGFTDAYQGAFSVDLTATTLTLHSAAGATLTFVAGPLVTASGLPSAPAPTSRPATPATPDAASVCGAWSAETSTFARGVAKSYGAIESCFPYGTGPGYWIVTTDGLKGGPGYIGVAACNSGACRSGAADHSGDHWVWYRADHPGAVRLYAPALAGQPLFVTVGGRQETFSLDTWKYGTPSPSIGAGGIGGLPVKGTLQVAGGPAPGVLAGVPGTVTFHGGNGVTVVATAAKDGTFTAAVPPGTWTVTGASPQYGGGKGVCAGDTVTIRSIPVPSVHVWCQVK